MRRLLAIGQVRGVPRKQRTFQCSSAAIAVGISLIVFFIPVHIRLWDKFPVWYHLFFLISLIPLSFVGSRIARSSIGERTSAVAT
jgi:hypothetical protein